MILQKVLIAFLILSVPVVALPFDWQIERVDTAGTLGNYPSLKLDSLGYPHIMYHDATYTPSPRYLKYAWWNGSAWNFDTVDVGDYCGISPSLEFDSLGRPCVAYQLWPTELRYAWRDGDEWVIEIVDTTGNTGFDPTLQFDSNWNPHIAFSTMDPNYDLRYAVRGDSEWTIYIIDTVGQTGYSACFALDNNDTAHICYRQEFEGIVKYATGDTAGWTISVVDSGPLVGSIISLALDSHNYPHISYGDYSTMNDMDLRYARYNGVDWTIEEVDTFDRVGFYSCIALDHNDHPHISYCDDSSHLGYNLKYAFWTGSGWYIEKVDAEGGDTGWQSSLVHQDSISYIAYLDREYGDLKYARAQVLGVTEDVSSASYSDISLLCSPNPFSSIMRISYEIENESQAQASITVYDVAGRLAHKLLSAGQTDKGMLFWHGDDEHGNVLADGIYFIVLKTDRNDSHMIYTEKVVIQR
jgi:hypothetical protein